MQLYVRDGKWHLNGYYWCEYEQRRKRLRMSTGIDADGSARSKRLAEQAAFRILQSHASSGARRTRPLSLEATIKIHIAKLERGGRSQATIDIVNEKSVHLYAHFGPDFDVTTLGASGLAEYADKRLKDWAHPPRDEYPGKLVSRGTVHRELRTLLEAMGSAKAIGRITGELPAMPDLGEVYTPKERWLPKAQSQALLMALNVRWRDHFVMYRQMGIDRMELYYIDPAEDISWSKLEVHIRGTKNKYRDRWIPMTDEVAEILQRRLKTPGPLFDFWHQDLRDMKRACGKAGLEPCCLKDLRRSFATDMAIAGKPILLVARLMGHSSTRMLEKVYARVERGQHMHEVIRAVAELRQAKPRDQYVPDSANKPDAADGGDSG